MYEVINGQEKFNVWSSREEAEIEMCNLIFLGASPEDCTVKKLEEAEEKE